MQEGEPKTNGQLPVISKKTADRLREELGLDVRTPPVDLAAGSISERYLQEMVNAKKETGDRVSSLEKIEAMTENTSIDLAEANPGLAKALTDGIKEGYVFGDSSAIRSCLITGMAIAIKAFNAESEYGLMQRLSKITDDVSIQRIKDIVVKSLGGGKGLDPLERALITPRIPDVQIELNLLVADAAKINPAYEHYYKEGAAAMYAVLSEFRTKLFPPSQNPPAGQPPGHPSTG